MLQEKTHLQQLPGISNVVRYNRPQTETLTLWYSNMATENPPFSSMIFALDCLFWSISQPAIFDFHGVPRGYMSKSCLKQVHGNMYRMPPSGESKIIAIPQAPPTMQPIRTAPGAPLRMSRYSLAPLYLEEIP